MHRVLFIVLAGFLLDCRGEAILSENFQNPPPEFRPLVIQHSVPLRDAKAMDYLRVRRSGGYVLNAGGVAISPSDKDIVGEENFISPTYLQVPDQFQRLESLLAILKAEGRTAWIYDEYAYPSGSAGGQVFAGGHDGYAAEVVGCRTFKGGEEVVSRADGVVVSCVAVPLNEGTMDLAQIQDLTGKARAGAFTYDSPGDSWVVLLFERYHPDTWKRHNMGRRMLNVLNRDAVKRFIEVTHQRYADELGPSLRNVEAFFSDEPQFGSAEFWGDTGLAKADPMVQWTDELLSAFEQKTGYELIPILPALFFDAGPQTAKYRYHFYDVQSDLMAENYFGQIQDWCNQHGVMSSGHMLLEESLLFHVMFSGSVFKNWMRQDLPGMDLLFATPYRSMGDFWEPDSMPIAEDLSCKMASSVAHLQGKKRVFSESCGLADPATLRDILGLVSWQYSGGITHMATYTIQNALSEEDYAKFCDFTGRMALFARRGEPVSKIAVLVPEASVWAAYAPPTGGGFKAYYRDNPEAIEIDGVFRNTCEALLSSQKQFECMNDTLLLQAEVEDGQLILGSMKFSMLILPEARFLSREVLEKLDEFVTSGGLVQWVGTLPFQDNQTGESPSVRKAVEDLIQKNPMQVRFSPELSLQWIEQSFSDEVVWSGDSAVRMLVKNDGAQTIVILGNPSEQPVSGRLKLNQKGAAIRWDPDTGERHDLAGGTVEIAL
ncbi:MAG: hypothetical protein DRP64_10545, partial [Verrucomicrobia bacterium]